MRWEVCVQHVSRAASDMWQAPNETAGPFELAADTSAVAPSAKLRQKYEPLDTRSTDALRDGLYGARHARRGLVLPLLPLHLPSVTPGWAWRAGRVTVPGTRPAAACRPYGSSKGKAHLRITAGLLCWRGHPGVARRQTGRSR